MRNLLLFAILCFGHLAQAQPYAIGTRQMSFFDVARNRTVAATVQYPAASAGNDVPVAMGTFPVLVVGHGFVMTTSVYGNLWNYFVPKGYIVVLPTTEGGFSPNHAAFGADLAFLGATFQSENTTSGSPFFDHVMPATALMGHSMGGGASFLGAAGNTNIQALVNFAPAETNPSAVAAASTVTVPTLVFAASEDCVTPIPAHQQPMYEALTVPCKAFVNILGGGHCYFAESNFNCTFGETTCGPNLTITRTQQHAVMNDIAGLWLDHFLKGDQQAYSAVLDSMSSSTRVQAQFTCLATSVPEMAGARWQLQPTTADDHLFISDLPANGMLQVVDASGRVLLSYRAIGGTHMLEVGMLPVGAYRLLHTASTGRSAQPFFVIR